MYAGVCAQVKLIDEQFAVVVEGARRYPGADGDGGKPVRVYLESQQFKATEIYYLTVCEGQNLGLA